MVMEKVLLVEPLKSSVLVCQSVVLSGALYPPAVTMNGLGLSGCWNPGEFGANTKVGGLCQSPNSSVLIQRIKVDEMR
jgi:hypothetical protein